MDINDLIEWVITHDEDGSPRGTNPPPEKEEEDKCDRCGMPLYYGSCDCSWSPDAYGTGGEWTS